MLPGPIFRVELVTAARRGRYFLARVIYASIILFVLWTTYESTTAMARYRSAGGGGGGVSISELAQAAAAFFYAFSWVQLLGLLAAAPAMVVGTIATERERRTIEYLFATDLTNLEIILGKTCARLLVIGKFALVSLPILLLFRLLGGIPADLVLASFLIAGSTSLVLTALSVCVSVWSKRSRDASVRVYMIVAALLVLPPLLSGMVGGAAVAWPWWQNFAGPALEFLVALNPVVVLGNSMGGVMGLGAGFDFAPVLRMAAWHTAAAVAMVGIATLAVRRVHLREVSRASSSGRRLLRLPSLGKLRWRPTVGNRPMVWKEAFAATAKTKLGVAGVLAALAIAATALGTTGVAFLSVARGESNREAYFDYLAGYTGFVGAALLLLLGSRAAGLVTIEKERDCWTSLLSTPLTGAEIMFGKLAGNLYAARGGAALLVIAWGLGVLLDVRYLIVALLSALTFLVCAWFVTVVGLVYSLRARTSLRAMGSTLATNLFVGGGYLFCCCPMFAMGVDGDREGAFLGMAPCMPFLLVYPSMSFDRDSNDVLSDSGGMILVAYCLGFGGYVVASAVLSQYLASNFDELAGRTTRPTEGRVLHPRIDSAPAG